VAFFEAPELPPLSRPPHDAYDTFQHLAMEVATVQEVDHWALWLRANDIDVLGPVNHKIIYSIYFHDPNGLRLELTTPLSPDWNDNRDAARESLAEWEQVKDQARQKGQNMADVMADLTRQRSHRRN
jgi:catechol-2,3-dioxygenase